MSSVTRMMAREILIMSKKVKTMDSELDIIKKVEKIKRLSEHLILRNPNLFSGITLGMTEALKAVVINNSCILDVKPVKGRPENTLALQLGKKFAVYYPMLAGKPAGVNADHDFVLTLGEIFRILELNAKPQHFAKKVVGQKGVL